MPSLPFGLPLRECFPSKAAVLFPWPDGLPDPLAVRGDVVDEVDDFAVIDSLADRSQLASPPFSYSP